jgi:hypothetical protein
LYISCQDGACQLLRAVDTGATRVNFSTLYRNLATFCDMGWLDAVPAAWADSEKAVLCHRGCISVWGPCRHRPKLAADDRIRNTLA